MKDCSICKYCDEDFDFDEETGEEYPVYSCQKGNDTSLDYECKDFEKYKPQNLASATQGILIDAAMPVLREEIKSPLSPFRYKDELEKALNDFHFGNMFMNGA